MKYLLILLLLLYPQTVLGQEMFSPSYTIDLEQVEATTEPKLDILNDLQLKRFSDDGFIVETSKVHMLQFSISDTVLTLSDLRSNRIQSSSVLTTITSSGVFGYQLLAMPLQGLESRNGDQIPPTICDGKSNKCTPNSAKKWKSNTAYGWGYNVSGPDAAHDFMSKEDYRPFKTGESAVISSNDATDSQRSAEVTVKVAVASDVPEGNYNSLVKLIALPKL